MSDDIVQGALCVPGVGRETPATATVWLVERPEKRSPETGRATRAVLLKVRAGAALVSVELSREWALILAETLERFATLATDDEL